MADGRITIDTKIDQSGIDKGIKDMQGKLNGVTGKMDRIGKTMSTTVTAPIVGLTGAIIKVGMDFESSMSHVQAVTGATGSEMQKLESLARELGETTKFSASDAADAMGFLGMAGYDTNQIMSAMPGLLDLAAAGQLELGRAADIATNIVSGFNMTAENTGMVSDVLAKAAASANTSVEQLGGAMSYVAPVASGAGLSLEETAAAIGVLSDNGIQGERAGTALRGVIASLQNPTGGTKRALEKLGLTAEDIDPSMNSLADILQKLENAGIDSKTAMEMVGVQAGPALIAMLNRGSDGLGEFTQDLIDSEGASSQMAETMSDNTKGSLQEFTSALEGVALAFADILLPIVTDFLDFLTTLVRKFGEMSPFSQKIILIIGGIAAAIGPLLLIISNMIKIFSMVIPIIKAVGAAIGLLASPVGLIIVAIGAVIGILVYLWNTSEGFRNAVINIWEGIKEIITVAIDAIVAFVMDIWGALVTFWEENGQMLIDSVVNVWEFIKPFIETYVTGIWETIKNIFGFIVDTIKIAWDTIAGVFQGTIDIIMGIVQFFGALFTGNWSEMWEATKKIFGGALDIIKSVVGGVFKQIKNVIGTIINSIKITIGTTWDIISGLTSKIWDGIWGGIKSITSKIWNGIKNVFDDIRDTISGVWDGIKETTDKIWDGIVNTIKGAINGVIAVINGMLDAIGGISIKTPKIPSWVPKFGGKQMDIGFPNLPKIPSLDVGTNFVARDGLAFLHRGEAVVPKKYNPAVTGKGGNTNIIVQEMHVRNEEDIYKVSRQLKRLQDRASLSKGVGGVSTI